MSTATLPHLRRVAVDRPITTLCVVAIGATLALQTGLLLAGIDLFPGKLAELVLLTGAATLITFWIGGRGAVRRLFGGLTKWRIGTRTLGTGVAGHADPHRSASPQRPGPSTPPTTAGPAKC